MKKLIKPKRKPQAKAPTTKKLTKKQKDALHYQAYLNELSYYEKYR